MTMRGLSLIQDIFEECFAEAIIYVARAGRIIC